MKTKSAILFILTFLLTACGAGTPAPVTHAPVATQPPTDIPTPTLLPTFTPDSLATFIPLPIPSLDPKYLPTSPPTPLINQQAIKAWQTQIAIATPIRTPITPSKTEIFPKVYIKDGNLYFQSNVDKTIQLTRSGKDRDFIISDDGQKIAF